MARSLLDALKKFENFILDMDGVLYTGNIPINRAKETLEELYESGKNIKYLTNFPDSRKTIRRKMKNVLNIDVPEEDIMTAAYATSVYIRNREHKTCYTIALDDLIGELEDNEIKILDTEEIIEGNKLKKIPDWVVISLYEDHDYYKRLNAAGHILRSKEFNLRHYLATSQGWGWTREDGVSPGVGCTISALKTFSGREPIVIGKPSNIITDLIFEQWKINPKDCIMVGDKWSDIETSNHYSAFGVKVETGKQDFFENIEKIDKNSKPKLILKSINGIFDEDEIIFCEKHD